IGMALYRTFVPFPPKRSPQTAPIAFSHTSRESAIPAVRVLVPRRHWAPMLNYLGNPQNAPVAQLDRAFASGAKGRPFESARAYQSKALNIRSSGLRGAADASEGRRARALSDRP